MRLKELHIRNIASIERADIDFEHGLNDAVTGCPASIFLISGDTGAGKSVILDSISMALYKNTPRIESTANKRQNTYTDNEGESLNINSIEQYTRLGISDKDECYSEVIFEGNDERTYHVRLTLGMKKSRKKDAAGNYIIKHDAPTWHMKTGNGDWTKTDEQVIEDAVGLNFQQFGRMAMLAQGQFANFLTGDKKEREDILEQLTNTQHFTAYGIAIKSLYGKAKDAQTTIQTQYDTEKPHTLSDEEVELLTKEQQYSLQQKDLLDKKIKAQEDMLKQVELVLLNEKAQEEALQKKHVLEAIVAGEEYQQDKMLFTDWDATTAQRHTIADLQKAKREEQMAKDGLQASHSTFLKLSADIVDRRNRAKALSDSIGKTQEWIDQHKQYDSLFTKAGETDLKIGQYLAYLKKANETNSLLQKEKEKTEPLRRAEENAVNKATEADKAVKAKETEIDTLSQQRTALNPQAINDQLSEKEGAKRSLEDLRKAYDALLANQKEADKLRDEIKHEEAKLATLKEAKEKAESEYKAKKEESEKADKLLTTMQMSVGDTLVAVRHRLQEEKAGICPLCGQSIDHTHLDDDFKGILTPLEEEQKKAADELSAATRRRDDSRDAYVKFEGALQGKVKQLTKDDKKNDADKQNMEGMATKMVLNIREPLIPQIENALMRVLADIGKLKDSQKEVERLQEEINKLLKEKKPLDAAKLTAEKAKTKAENDVKGNAETIARLDEEHKAHLRECERMKEEVNKLLSGYADNWLTDTDAARKKLKDDAKEYEDHQKQLADHTTAYDKANTLINSLSKICDNIIQSCPDWQVAEQAQSYPCRDINTEWTTLMGKVTTFTSKLKECKHTIADSNDALSSYYQESGKTEQMLLALMAKEQQVAAARRFVSETDSQLKSRIDAISDAQKQIDAAFNALNITDRSELPEKQQLEEEKTATNNLRDEILSKMAQTKNRLDTHYDNIKKLKEIEVRLEEAKRRFARWDKLNSIFGGTRFRTLVQTYILRPLLNNANIYLQQITDRYRLTCSEDNEQLSILVHDRYNKDQVRSVTVLSGGERFMISLALSLALSSLNRPDMNVNILFIDEGFGTLDEKSLDSVMQTLEKLQEIAGQTNRRVGIISHREELEERIPVKIQVIKKGEGRSMIEVTNA
jgi:DNA repair exonuclease SbcCD ATPase subunit